MGKKVSGICRLCDKSGALCQSHIIPKFAFKWLKESSATGHIRFARNPNKRSQDGYKPYWLCTDCERKFNVWETEFSKKIFLPLHRDDLTECSYGPWFLKFSVSVSWRTLQYLMDDGPGLSDFPDHLRASASEALMTWKEFLMDRVENPAQYEQHILLLGRIGGYTKSPIPPNINRYISRSVGFDAACSERQALVFSKMCRIFLVGFIEIPKPKEWSGTKIRVRKGVVGGNKDYKIPGAFGNYILDHAKKVGGIFDRISPAQHQKIRDSYRQNIERAVKSETFKAMHHDVILFGDEVFKK